MPSTQIREKRNKKSSEHKELIAKIYLSLAILFATYFTIFNSLHPSSLKHEAIRKVIAQEKTIPTNTPTLTPTNTPTPLPTSTPTPTILEVKAANDFCLNVPIILYHHIQPMSLATAEGHASLTVDEKFFDLQMQYLSTNGYTPLSVDQLVQALINHQELSAKSVVITLDDGYDDAYTYAYPILKKYNVIGNFMIPTGLMENPGYLTWSHLKEMIGSKLVYTYDHTWSHAALGNQHADEKGKEKILYEITTGRTQLKDNVGQDSPILTYPYGSTNNFVIQILKENGFIAALSTKYGRIQCDSNIMNLYRIHIGNAPLSSYGF